MKEIFDKIKDREWDWFGASNCDGYGFDSQTGHLCVSDPQRDYSTADLLANKSWCKAVWGDSIDCVCTGYSHDCKCNPQWINCSQYAFAGLQISGEESCLKYIKETMNA